MWRSKWVGLTIEVESGHGSETDTVGEFRPRWAGKDFDAVTLGHQCFREFAGVDALTTNLGIAPVHQESNAQPPVARWARRYGVGH